MRSGRLVSARGVASASVAPHSASSAGETWASHDACICTRRRAQRIDCTATPCRIVPCGVGMPRSSGVSGECHWPAAWLWMHYPTCPMLKHSFATVVRANFFGKADEANRDAFGISRGDIRYNTPWPVAPRPLILCPSSVQRSVRRSDCL